MRARVPSFFWLLASGLALASASVGCSADGDLPSYGPDLPDSGAAVGSGGEAAAGDDAASPAPKGPTDSGSDAPVTTVDVDQIPWATGADVGFGVAKKDTGNTHGNAIFIAYAGYNISLDSAKAWATALYRADLEARGVRYLFAVQGPSNPTYTQKEIGNSKIISAMLPLVTSSTKFVLVAGHSSGSFVAHELLGQLQGGLDPQGVTAGRVVYFNLEGGSDGLNAAVVGRLHRAYFVASHDPTTNTYSANASTMQSLGATYASAGGYYENDATGSGCNAGATWCLHVTLVTTKPHNPADADPVHDYSDFVGRPVCRSFLDAKASSAGL